MTELNDLYNALAKIHSIMHDMAETRKVSQEHMNDYNDTQHIAGIAFAGVKEKLKISAEGRRVAAEARDKVTAENRKLTLITRILGLTKSGMADMMAWEEPFLQAIAAGLEKNRASVRDEAGIVLLKCERIWIQQRIQQDCSNIASGRFFSNLHKSIKQTAPEASLVKQQIKEIMEGIATESAHILPGIRDNKTTEELLPAIEQHWYKQLKERVQIEIKN